MNPLEESLKNAQGKIDEKKEEAQAEVELALQKKEQKIAEDKEAKLARINKRIENIETILETVEPLLHELEGISEKQPDLKKRQESDIESSAIKAMKDAEDVVANEYDQYKEKYGEALEAEGVTDLDTYKSFLESKESNIGTYERASQAPEHESEIEYEQLIERQKEIVTLLGQRYPGLEDMSIEEVIKNVKTRIERSKVVLDRLRLKTPKGVEEQKRKIRETIKANSGRLVFDDRHINRHNNYQIRDIVLVREDHIRIAAELGESGESLVKDALFDNYSQQIDQEIDRERIQKGLGILDFYRQSDLWMEGSEKNKQYTASLEKARKALVRFESTLNQEKCADLNGSMMHLYIRVNGQYPSSYTFKNLIDSLSKGKYKFEESKRDLIDGRRSPVRFPNIDYYIEYLNAIEQTLRELNAKIETNADYYREVIKAGYSRAGGDIYEEGLKTLETNILLNEPQTLPVLDDETIKAIKERRNPKDYERLDRELEQKRTTIKERVREKVNLDYAERKKASSGVGESMRKIEQKRNIQKKAARDKKNVENFSAQFNDRRDERVMIESRPNEIIVTTQECTEALNKSKKLTETIEQIKKQIKVQEEGIRTTTIELSKKKLFKGSLEKQLEEQKAELARLNSELEESVGERVRLSNFASFARGLAGLITEIERMESTDVYNLRYFGEKRELDLRNGMTVGEVLNSLMSALDESAELKLSEDDEATIRLNEDLNRRVDETRAVYEKAGRGY